jgi:ArsR family transcriptional regulator
MSSSLNTDTQTLEEVIAILKALSDHNRLRILDVLMQGISCNGELNDRLGLPPNLLSHHLRVLREAGLVTSRRDVIDGRWIYYEVDQEAVTRWQSWFTGFLNPARLQERPLCGPEGQEVAVDGILAACQTTL